MQQQEGEQFIVAPIMSNQKQTQFKENILQTIFGVHKNNLSLHRIEELILLFPITFIIPLVVSNRIVAIVVPTAINVILNLLEDIFRSETLKIGTVIVRNCFLGIFTFLWASHLFFLIQYNNTQIYNITFSGIAIATSIYTIARQPVKQFGANGFQNNEVGWNSTLYMRFFIAFPTLFAQFIIFNSMELTGIMPSNPYLFPLRIINSLIFVTWWFGWLSSLGTTLYFILNKMATLILGNQSESSFKGALMGIINNMIPIAIYMIIYSRSGEVTLTPMITGASATSIVTFFRYNLFWNRISSNYWRSLILILIQVAVCIMLNILNSKVNLSSVNLTVLLAIDIALYVAFFLVKQLLKGWSYFGFIVNVECIKLTYLNLAQRIVLRIISALCILVIVNGYSQQYMSILPYSAHILNYTAVPFLTYRSFKRCISQSTSFSLHVSLLLGLILINAGRIPQGILLVLMMPPFPSWIWTSIVSIFKIPKKLLHKNQCLYQIAYFFLSFLGFCIYFLTLGTLELTMVFGLPIYYPVIPTQTEGFEVKSAQNSLYEKILQNVDKSIFRYYEKGYYLLRIQKYILLLEIKSNCFGFCQLIDIRGLQVQEVTSCHSKEGETIDKLVEETWGDNKKCFSLEPYDYVLTPYVREKVSVPTQNEIQLTGIIESSEFVTLFKSAALKAIVWELSKLKLTENQVRDAEVMAGQFSAIFKKDAAESLFPYEFASRCNINGAYPVQSGKVKLKPLNPKGKKTEVVDDFLDLLDNSGGAQKFEVSNNNLNEKQKSNEDSKILRQTKQDELNMVIVLTFYYYAIGKQDYINQSKIYRLIKRESDAVTQIEFENFAKIISLAIGAAFKISVDKYIEGDLQVSFEDFTEYEKTSFLGTSDSDQFKRAILADKEHVWNLTYSKKMLGIKRMAHSQTTMFVFKVDETILKSVWNNLRFELIYATNNDDERYSIQTHPNLMRNLWVEACEEPFGYPSYHSGLMLNL